MEFPRACYPSHACRINRLAFILAAAGVILAAVHTPIAAAQEKAPWTIELGKLQAPTTTMPDEKIQVNLPIHGGPKDEEFEVTLEASRLTDRDGKPAGNHKKAVITRRGKFGEKNTRLTMVLIIDLQAILQVKADKDTLGLLEGTWEFRVQVPRHARETFDRPIHETTPIRILVRQRKPRILLFAAQPTRDFQFLRTLLARESRAKRLELSIYLQSGRPAEGGEQDVPAERLLSHFPNRRGPDDPKDKFSSISMYDVIIAFDPDWSALKAEQIKLLEQWVGRDAGGFIFVAGPVHSYQLARNDQALQTLKSILPVELKDNRIAVPTVDMKTPYPLHFTKSAGQFSFLKVDGEGIGPFAGWDRLFWGEARKPARIDDQPQRGIFSYYPVEKARAGATVLATFAGPKETRINGGKDEQPYLVYMPYGNGRSFYIGSSESWRLRQYRESYHESFWINLARHMSAENSNRDLAPQKAVQILIIDGDPSRAKEAGKPDYYYVRTAIKSIPANPYEVILGHELAEGASTKVLERDDLARFGAIMLLNVRDLKDKQLANLEKYTAEGGGVAFFLGPKVSSTYYNQNLFKDGKGLFPVPLESTYYPPKSAAALRREPTGGDMVLLRFDLFSDPDRYPVFGAVFRDKESRAVLQDLPVRRYFKVPRDEWRPDPSRVFELATLPNEQPVATFKKDILDIFFSQQVKAILADPANAKYVPGLQRHRTAIVITVSPTAKKKSYHLADALEKLLLDRGQADDEDYPNMTEFWAGKDAKIQQLRAEVAQLLHRVRYSDPLIVGAKFGKGRVLAVLTTAGPEWNDWAAFGKCLGSFVYQPFIWECVNYLTRPKT